MDKTRWAGPDWKNHQLDTKEAERSFKGAMAKLLAYCGFMPLDRKGGYQVAFRRV
jgi:hypothetical protein